MPFIREMRCVLGALEILGPKIVVPDIDDALRCIEKLDVVFFASLAYGFRHFREHRSVDIPRGYEPYPCLWKFCFDARAEAVKPLQKHLL